MTTPPSTPNINSLRIIYFAVVFGQVVFLAAGSFLHMTDGLPMTLAGEMLPVLIGSGTAAAAVLAGKALFATRLRVVRESSSDADALRLYFSAFIILLAMLEAATLILLVLFLMTGHMLLPLLVLAVLAVAAMHYPSRERIARDLGRQME